MIHTRLCDLLGIDHPIISAPMAGTAGAALAAAVSAAGGFGLIGGSGGGPDWLRAEIRAVRAHTIGPSASASSRRSPTWTSWCRSPVRSA